MKVAHLCLNLALLLGVQGSPLLSRTGPPTVVDSSSKVTYVGNTSYEVDSFLNIRFGQETSGNNRFKAPLAFSYPAGTVVNASAPGAACPQQKVPLPGIPILSNVTDVSEDCLNLRIDRPEGTAANAKLPVMVYIYGGGFSVGQIYDTAYTPTLLVAGSAAKKMPIIYVAINYRVGIFGSISSPAVSSDNLNAGLLDQRLGLQWVQENIGLFGGDPDNVTVFGESAGGQSIGFHLVSYAGNSSMAPPFKRAIMQSGAVTSQTGVVGNQTAVSTAEVISQLNCTSSQGDHAAELSCISAAPLDVLLPAAINVSLAFEPLGGFNAFSPVVPSPMIPSPPSTLLYTGAFHKSISVISGWMEDDSSLFTPTSIRTESDLETWLTQQNMSSTAISQIEALYPASSFQDLPSENITASWFRAEQMSRDQQIVCPSILTNAAMANASNPSTTTNYLFALNSTLFAPFFAKANKTYLGVCHGSDLAFVFNQASVPQYGASSQQIALASQISGAWAQFASTGVLDGNASTNAIVGNLTVAPWTQAASSGDTVEYPLRILGGPRNGMASIHDFNSTTTTTTTTSSLPSYDEDQLRRCLFWNSPAVLEMSGT